MPALCQLRCPAGDNQRGRCEELLMCWDFVFTFSLSFSRLDSLLLAQEALGVYLEGRKVIYESIDDGGRYDWIEHKKSPGEPGLLSDRSRFASFPTTT